MIKAHSRTNCCFITGLELRERRGDDILLFHIRYIFLSHVWKYMSVILDREEWSSKYF